MIRAIVRRVGLRRVRRVVMAAVVATLLSGAFAAVLLGSPGIGGRAGDDLETLQSVDDKDLDGLPDAVENRFGSDSARYSTLGSGIPDGWVQHWLGPGIDWNDTGILQLLVLVPPPDVLPAPLVAGGFTPPTLAELYRFENETRGGTYQWWLPGTALDPFQWDNNDDGVADAWLVRHGVDPFLLDPQKPAPGDPSMTLQEKYEAGLNPAVRDTDGDGLDDVAERSGFARFEGVDRSFKPTNAKAFSTRGDTMPDGFAVRFGLDPHDANLEQGEPAGDGVTVAQAYHASVAFCAAAGPCDVAKLVRSGPLVDPTKWDTVGDGVADAWSLEDTAGLAHPLRDGRTVTAHDSSSWDAKPWGGSTLDLHGYVEDGFNPPPTPVSRVTLLDLYTYQRPSAWSESQDGPWWGGISPGLESPTGALPPAVALRGWEIQIENCRGCNETRLPREDQLLRLHVDADPRSADSDSDGLTDRMEYFGVDGGGATIPRIDPRDPDTDRDGLRDAEELALGTNPVRLDTSGSFLTDGEEAAYWLEQYDRAVHLLATDPVQAEVEFGWLADASGLLRPEDAQRLHPTGSILGDTPNILAPDADGDGLLNGAELQPDRYLGKPSTYVRPATHPARPDTDGDGLPDVWEVRWSQDRYYDCSAPCVPPLGAHEHEGWPTDPTRWNSFQPGPDAPSDAVLNLAGDSVRVSALGETSEFTNHLAYKYNLHPFDSDTDGDGLTDQFEIHWGVEAIPDDADDRIRDLVEQQPATFGWVRQQADRLGARVPPELSSARPEYAVLDPSSGSETLSADTDILGRFFGREKGTWVAEPQAVCAVTTLPGPGHPSLQARHEGEHSGIEARVGLVAPCWRWIPYTLADDAEHRTNPWSYDLDGDHIPDGWEAHYGGDLGLDPGVVTAGSIASGCRDPLQTGGLDRTCLTVQEAYSLGIDPRIGDTDGGGLPDWKEVALGLDPLNHLDDRGEEDWDGDGLRNRVEDAIGTSRLLPDTDGDGLLDGDGFGVEDEKPPYIDFGNGNGDLCVRRGADMVPLTEHRPAFLGPGDAGGSLTHTQRFDLLVRSGVLMDENPGSVCPDPVDVGGKQESFVLFKREVSLDRWTQQGGGQIVVLGAGQGSDPLRWDTSGDGVPDGWIVYWRDQPGNSQPVREALDPNDPQTGASNPDNDLLTSDEYVAARPSDWDEGRDGPWWGGLDPTRPDTDGDEDWFEVVFSGGDALDDDWDGDGVPESIDAHPGLDADGGIFSWDASAGRHRTDHDKLWDALDERKVAYARDADTDGVPDFLDRARVKVSSLAARWDDGTFVTGFNKGEPTPFFVTGSVTVSEAPLGGRSYDGPAIQPNNGAPVVGATVKVLVGDGDAEALLGFGLTRQDGGFSIRAVPGPTVSMPGPGVPFSVDSKQSTGATLTVSSGLADLQAGPAALRVVVEANDPTFQAVRFGQSTWVTAYKDLDEPPSTQFRIPAIDGPGAPMRAAMLRDGPNGPEADPDAGHVRHRAEAVFVGVSVEVDVEVRSTAVLEFAGPTTRPRAGEALEAGGRLLDAQGAPLPGRVVEVDLLEATTRDVARSANRVTAQDGTYAASIDTNVLSPGAYILRAHAIVGQSDPFLEAPDSVEHPLVLAQDTHWADPLRINGLAVSHGVAAPPTPSDESIRVTTILQDSVTGSPVAGRGFTMRLVSTSDGSLRGEAQGLTDEEDGRVDVTFPAPPDATPLGLLRLEIHAVPTTPADVAGRAEAFLELVYPTRVEAEGVTIAVGEAGFIQGRVLRGAGAGAPVGPGLGMLQVTGPKTLTVSITNPAGEFRIPVDGATPEVKTWTLRFDASSDQLRDSPAATTVSRHVSGTAITITDSSGIREKPVPLKGKLLLSDGSPSAGAVEARWEGGAWVAAQAGPDGAWSLHLPARPTAGHFKAEVRFAGTEILHPSSVEATAAVKMPSQIHIEAGQLRVGSDGGADWTIASTLRDADGGVLSARRIEHRLVAPHGGTQILAGVTDSQGAVSVRWSDLREPAPGIWNITADYAGAELEAPSTITRNVTIRVDAAVELGLAPASVEAETRVVLKGRLAAAADVGPVSLSAYLDGTLVGNTVARAGTPWALTLAVPAVVPGPHNLTITGASGPFVDVSPLTETLHVRMVSDVHLREVVSSDGGRLVTVSVHGRGGDVGVTVVRHDDNGSVLGVHRATTAADGTATFSLSSLEQGQLSVVHLSDPSVRIGETTLEVVTIPAPPAGGIGITWIVALAALVFAAAIVAAYFAWSRRHRAEIVDVFTEARHALLDPNASARQIVQRAYEQLLRVLDSAGYQPAEELTVRDVASEATKAFGLPGRPMWAVTRLFERAIYSEEQFNPRDRRTAVAAFVALGRTVRRQT